MDLGYNLVKMSEKEHAVRKHELNSAIEVTFAWWSMACNNLGPYETSQPYLLTLDIFVDAALSL